MTNKITGGFFITPREHPNPRLMIAPPHYRETYNWLTRNAQYRDIERDGLMIHRGELLTSYEEIQHGLRWYVGNRPCRYTKTEIKRAVSWLKKRKSYKDNTNWKILGCANCRLRFFAESGKLRSLRKFV